jgi:hypothetical protein
VLQFSRLDETPVTRDLFGSEAVLIFDRQVGAMSE